MKILIVGLGVIGSTYGHLFEKAGHEVEHLIRKDSPKADIKSLAVELLDGRISDKGSTIRDSYRIKSYTARTYDFIFISIPEGGLTGVLADLEVRGISGTLLVNCGIWQDKDSLDSMMQGWNYILGYPVAGGNIKNNLLTCCVFDHFMLEREEKAAIPNYQELVQLFEDCSIKLEQPYDMLEWIWLHMAINAGVISAIGKYGDMTNTTASVEQAIASSKALREAVIAIRETSRIVAARGVILRNYANELLPYKIPTFLSVPLMKRMFAKKVLTRKIITLHNNLSDLLFVCQCLYDSGKAQAISAPHFYEAYNITKDKLSQMRS
ncbi:ketopantoate reductase family protein [Streptococcus dentapri]|uniref:Ketopantoate reductase family protein n=1 Tax=Streptococcus dentapri TaxID=573564 RepID=A0ABV8CZQ8_9STRE